MQSVWAVPKLVHAWQGGFSPGDVRKNPFHMQVHTRACICKTRQASAPHIHICGDKPLQLTAAEKPKRHPEMLGFSSLHSELCMQPLQNPPCPKSLSPAPWLRPCPVPRAAGLPSQSTASPHRTACSERAQPHKTEAGMAVSFVYHEPGLLPDSSAPTASIKCVNHFLATQAPKS